jgi:hypothetical protein
MVPLLCIQLQLSQMGSQGGSVLYLETMVKLNHESESRPTHFEGVQNSLQFNFVCTQLSANFMLSEQALDLP